MRIFHSNESCLLVAILPPTLSFGGKREQNRQLSFEWKILILIGHHFCCYNFCNVNFNELHNGRYKFVESHLWLLKIVLDSNKSSTISMCCHIRMHDTSTKRKQRWVFCPITKTYHTTARYMHHKTSVIFTLKKRFFRPNHEFPCLMGNITTSSRIIAQNF